MYNEPYSPYNDVIDDINEIAAYMKHCLAIIEKERDLPFPDRKSIVNLKCYAFDMVCHMLFGKRKHLREEEDIDIMGKMEFEI